MIFVFANYLLRNFLNGFIKAFNKLSFFAKILKTYQSFPFIIIVILNFCSLALSSIHS